jgi:Uma2 family endonuclease
VLVSGSRPEIVLALAVKRDARMSVAAYKPWVEPRPDEERWELRDGVLAPPSARAQRIVTNLVTRRATLAEKRSCGTCPGLAILSAAMDDDAPYPDVVVPCGPMPPTGFVDDPLVIVEALLPVTMTNDRGRKLAFHATVPSLQSLPIVSQNAPRIEVWRPDAGWATQVAGPGGSVALPELGGSCRRAASTTGSRSEPALLRAAGPVLPSRRDRESAMALAAKRDARMDVSAFRPWVEGRPAHARWDLLDGVPVPMAPPRERHQAIVANLIRRSGDVADGKGCRAMPGLAILSAATDDCAPIPGVAVRCGPPLPEGDAEDPLLVAEVLSPSTMSLDRGREIDFHRIAPSLQVLLIVYSDVARVEVWRRAGADWSVTALGLDGAVALPECDGAVPVRDIDRGLAF